MPLSFGIAREIGPFPSQNKPPLLVQPQVRAFWSAFGHGVGDISEV